MNDKIAKMIKNVNFDKAMEKKEINFIERIII